MSTNGQKKRTRQQRVATVELPPGFWGSLLNRLQRGSVLLRLAMCALLALFLWVFTRGWQPPFTYQLGDIPARDIVASIDFEQIDEKATAEREARARRLAKATYNQDPAPLVQLRAQLLSEISKVLVAENFDEVDPELWNSFVPPPAAATPELSKEEQEVAFASFRASFAAENALDDFDEEMSDIMSPFEQKGLIEALPEEHENLNFEEIFVRMRVPDGEGYGTPAVRAITEVRIKDAADKLKKSLEKNLSIELAQSIFAWLRPRLPTTLTIDLAKTRETQDDDAAETEPATRTFQSGKDTLAKGGEPLDLTDLSLLKLEYQASLEARDVSEKVRRSLAVLGMYVALYTLCGFYVTLRQPNVIDELLQFVTLLSLILVCVVLSCILSGYMWGWGTDLIPLLLLAMIMSIAYQQEMSLLLSACVTLVLVVSVGYDMSQALVYLATITGAILVLKQVRTRRKLLGVGIVSGSVAFFTTLGVGTLYGQPWSFLVQSGLLLALWSIIAGSLMTVLLPFVENIFEVQTDQSLIELGDPAHPLLQELIRRAPGTYNHSITVASLAEAAAESIGARGLLVRVGAYFHDIGKMLKPGYFIENQSHGGNRHDTLVPAMSTLVIIAHVKDGADLARQNKLPEQIIDFIQQHHGTTLVEYFYRQASEQRDKDPESAEVDESSFRYPGPKPQTKEAGVLMLADAVESASRALKEPTPARIENIVEELSRKRLLDGQFDECGLTLEEVHKIGESLVKSLTAMYHGRVKYPGQETA